MKITARTVQKEGKDKDTRTKVMVKASGLTSNGKDTRTQIMLRILGNSSNDDDNRIRK